MGTIVGSIFAFVASIFVFWLIVRSATRADAIVERLDWSIKRMDTALKQLDHLCQKGDGTEKKADEQ